jgi:hypothetical protein
MPRQKLMRETCAPVVIDRDTVYTLAQARAALGLRRDTLSGAIRRGELRVSRRAGRYWFLGAWLLEWIGGGELKCNRPSRGGRDQVHLPPRPEGSVTDD